MRAELGPNTCRVCLEPSHRLQSIDESREEGEETPNEMLTQLLGFQYCKLNGKDQIPQGICKQCKVELNMAFQFREKALRKQVEIELHFREMGLLEEVGEYLVKEESGSQSSYHQVDDIHEFTLNSVQSVEGVEVDDGSQNDDFLEVEGTDDQQEVITDDIEYLDENYSIEIDPNHDPDAIETTASATDIKVVRGRTRLTMDTMRSDHDELDQSYSVDVDLKAKRARRRPALNSLRTSDGTEKGGYVCDVCGNFYEKRGRMMEHRRRHDSVFQYQCELCDSKFQVREQLRKHMFSHTGSKPFKCSYCSRQFFYESVLKSHENVHRGIKPYVCKVCDKPFAYAHSLTKHELIHSDIKLYRCEYCQKDFRLLHHMRQHEETKCHQNAVMLAETLKFEREDQEVEMLAVDDHKTVKLRLS